MGTYIPEFYSITRRALRLFSGHHPRSVYLHYITSLCITVQNLPGFSPPFLYYTVSDQKLDGEKVWEQGYPMSTSTSVYLHVC